VTALAGGVGGARFLRGLTRRTDDHRLTIVVNTADDETFFGLHVSPDVDTIVYTLAGRADPDRGWGLCGDSFACLEALGALAEPTWFQLGDRDLATHLFRTTRLQAGWSLARVTAALANRHGLVATVLPMSNDRVRTFVHTQRGRRPFQRYLVGDRARGRVRRIEIAGARRARPSPGVLRAIATADVVILTPSNPLVSIGPILAIPAIRRAIVRRRRPTVAISPLVGGRPVRGPLDRMLRGLGHPVSPAGVAALYRGLVDVFVLDRRDRAHAPAVEQLGMRVLVEDTLMHDRAAARRLASRILADVDPARA
jgi:LPPG:FO 2-phospho-L-lactate transferase